MTALSELASDEDIQKAVKEIEIVDKDPSIFPALFQAENPKFIQAILTKYRNEISNTARITLLAHPSKVVRLAAIEAVKDVNELGALNAIIELYNAEVDPEVRKAYSDNLWVIKQRMEKK